MSLKELDNEDDKIILSQNTIKHGLQPYKFQEKIVRELLRLPSKHKYNASDMGTGKSIMTCLYANTIGAKNMLVVCPANLRINWARECMMWFRLKKNHVPIPILSARDIVKYQKKNLLKRYTLPTPMIVSYDHLVSSDQILNYLLSRKWDLLVIDEFHYCKNLEAQRTSRVLNYLWDTAEEVMPMSGTPLTKAATDIFPALMKIAPELNYLSKKDKKLCTNFELFAETFSYKWDHPTYGVNYKGIRHPDKLRALIDRTKSLVRITLDEAMPELPDASYEKLELNIDIKLSADEDMLGDFIEAFELEERRGKTLVKEKAIGTVRRELGEAKAKSKETKEFIRNLVEDYNEPVVIFTFHRSVLRIMQDNLKRFDVVTFEGGLSPSKKQKAVDDFQSGRADVFLGQVIAAGVGLTLTRARHCIFLEWDWLPSNNLQALKRLLRIGQKNHVISHWIVSKNEFDSNLISSMIHKQKQIEKVI